MAVQFEHSAWNGFTFYDFIFPFFLFISRVSIPFSITKRLEKGDNRGDIYLHILKRACILFLLGFLVNNLNKLGSPGDWRWMGVLQRFALCNLVASLLVMKTNQKGQLGVVILILLGYWAMMALIPVPGYGAGVLTPEGTLQGLLTGTFYPTGMHGVAMAMAIVRDY